MPKSYPTEAQHKSEPRTSGYYTFRMILIVISVLSIPHSATYSGTDNNEQLISSHEGATEVRLLMVRLNELKVTNYLIDNVGSHDGGMSILLNQKTWNNPKDTRKIADSVASLMTSISIPTGFNIKIMHKGKVLYLVSNSETGIAIVDQYAKAKSSSPKSPNPSRSQLRAAAHKAVLANCQCTILEWDSNTFDYMRAEGNDWETLENFVSKGREGIAKSLCAYVKLRYSRSTGKLSVVEVDYYSPDTCD